MPADPTLSICDLLPLPLLLLLLSLMLDRPEIGRSGKSVWVLLSAMRVGGLVCSKLVRRLEGAFGADVKIELCVLVRQLAGRLTADRGRSPDVRAAKTA